MMRSTTQPPSSTIQALLTRLRASAGRRGQNVNLLQCQQSRESGDRSHRPPRTHPEPSSPCPSIFTKSLDGVTVLHDCAEATVDICLVHGLTGDRNSAWTAEGHGQPWPASLLPSKLSRARILTYGYDAYILRKSVASTNGLIEHATTLLNDLATERASSNATSRPIIFVAHCIGGLVCKEAMLLSRNHPEPRLRAIFESTKGLAFMGTPHDGSWTRDWANIRASDLGVLKSTNRSLLEILETDDEYLQSVQDRFGSLIQEKPTDGHGLEITCFFEELPLPGVVELVPKKSATLGNQDPIGIHANHYDMIRFSSADEHGFKRLLESLIRWEAQIKAVVTNQPEPLLSGADISEMAEPRGNEAAESPTAAEPQEIAEPEEVAAETHKVAETQEVAQALERVEPQKIAEPPKAAESDEVAEPNKAADSQEVAEPPEVVEAPRKAEPEVAAPHEAAEAPKTAEVPKVVEPNYTYKLGVEASGSTSRISRDLSPRSGSQLPPATLHHKGSFRSWLRHKKDEAIEFAHEKKEEAIQFAHENGLDV